MQMMYVMLNVFAFWLGLSHAYTVPGQLILAGIESNAVVCVANNWKMPVYTPDGTVTHQSDSFHIINPKHANFPFLGDWIVLPVSPDYYLDMSPGDLMIMVGSVWLAWNALKNQESK